MAALLGLRATAEAMLVLVREIATMGADLASAASPGSLGADCLRFTRKISLLSHFFEEIRDFAVRSGDAAQLPPAPSEASSSAPRQLDSFSCLADLLMALEAAKRCLLICQRAKHDSASFDAKDNNITIQFQYVTWQLEKVIGNVSYQYFQISEEVQEQVELICVQLRRATEKIGSSHLRVFLEIYDMLSQTHCKELKQQRTSSLPVFHIEDMVNGDQNFEDIAELIKQLNGMPNHQMDKELPNIPDSPSYAFIGDNQIRLTSLDIEETKKPQSLQIPEDFRCPISLELMKDPVIVSTGQTYERIYIQKWIDCGHKTCPKTQQKLQNLTLTPNYVLRSLIMQWCETHKVEQPCKTVSGWIRKSDGTFHEFTGDRAAIELLVCNLSSRTLEDQKSAAAELRSLAKRSTDNRILIAEAGAIPVLVKLLSVNDHKIQEHSVTALLNLSIYDHNKELIVMAGAIVPIFQVLKCGSMEARENAAAAIFSLSLIDENKITIGSIPGAFDALIELLYSGSNRGKKDAATALFNLCIYQGNKARAVRSGILSPLLKMLQDPLSNSMVDEALTIVSVLVSHQECKVAIAKANIIPLLIDLIRTGLPRNKENAAAILLALCKKDNENLAYIGRLGALIPLTELAKNGTDRAKRKATSLLEHLSKLQVL
ncbi:U-box domain-containing protein 10 [Curcuma longa]|uniref:U-box domain-containing protein 10 n=1 Tax=Curcuma longa TaxID=136217 RepID=UPI003D9E689B